jgi:DNA primase
MDNLQLASLVSQIKRSISIETLTAEHSKIERRGSHTVCLSPLREERNASFYIYGDHWWDYGLQEGGDIIDLEQQLNGGDFIEVVNRLADRAGIPHELRSGGLSQAARDLLDRFVERRWVAKLQTRIAQHYHSTLPGEIREHIRDHYGLTDSTIDRLLIGWSLGDVWDKMIRCGERPERLLATGMFIQIAGGAIFEQHERRITMPYWLDGRVVYMISRRLDGHTPDDRWQRAKYKKSLVYDETKHPYVSKDVQNNVLWGEDCLKGPIEQVLVAEGVTDAMAAWQHGLNVISPVTTNFKESDIERICQRTAQAKQIIILNDNEQPRKHRRTGKEIQPGLDGAKRTAHRLHIAGRDVLIGILPRDKRVEKVDLNSYLRDQGRDQLCKEVLDKAVALPTLLMREIPRSLAPQQIEQRLEPIYELISASSPIAQQIYIGQLSGRFSISRRAIKAQLQANARAQRRQESRQTDQQQSTETGHDGADGNEAPPPLPPRGEGGRYGNGNALIQGCIIRSPEGCYLRQTPEGEVKISSFVIEPVYIAKVDTRQRLCCNIVDENGDRYDNVLLPETAFNGSRKLLEALHAFDPMIAWSGSDTNVQGLSVELKRQRIPIFKGVPMIGYALSPKGEPRWVTPKAIISSDGPMKKPDLVYAPLTPPPPMVNKLDISGASLSDREIKDKLAEILPWVHRLNEPEVILTLTSWFTMVMIAPAIRSYLGHLPLLWIYGTQGTGKTAIVNDVMWPLFHGVRSVPGSCSDTPFALIRALSCSSSVANAIDEYKNDQSIVALRNICRMLRRSYVGDTEQRGRPDLSVQEFQLTSPVCVMGEMGPDDPALRERIIPVVPLKHSLTRERRAAMRAALRLSPSSLSGGIVKLILREDPLKHIRGAKRILSDALSRDELSPRIWDNLLAIYVGDSLMRTIIRWAGISMSIRPALTPYLGSILDQITEVGQDFDDIDEEPVQRSPERIAKSQVAEPISEGTEGERSSPRQDALPRRRRVLDAMDLLMKDLETYAHMGLILEGLHYIFVRDRLYLHLPSCHKTYLEERRRTGEKDRTNGLNSLRRIIREKRQDEGSYVLNDIGRAQLGKSQPRCIIIDPYTMGQQINVEMPCASLKGDLGNVRSIQEAREAREKRDRGPV